MRDGPFQSFNSGLNPAARHRAACEASHCMTNSTVSATQQRADRLLQKALGNRLAILFSDAIAEPPSADLLLLIEKDDQQPPSIR
jgi:hypothetical protein